MRAVCVGPPRAGGAVVIRRASGKAAIGAGTFTCATAIAVPASPVLAFLANTASALLAHSDAARIVAAHVVATGAVAARAVLAGALLSSIDISFDIAAAAALRIATAAILADPLDGSCAAAP